jgi:hypothetical protein
MPPQLTHLVCRRRQSHSERQSPLRPRPDRRVFSPRPRPPGHPGHTPAPELLLEEIVRPYAHGGGSRRRLWQSGCRDHPGQWRRRRSDRKRAIFQRAVPGMLGDLRGLLHECEQLFPEELLCDFPDCECCFSPEVRCQACDYHAAPLRLNEQEIDEILERLGATSE